MAESRQAPNLDAAQTKARGDGTRHVVAEVTSQRHTRHTRRPGPRSHDGQARVFAHAGTRAGGKRGADPGESG